MSYVAPEDDIQNLRDEDEDVTMGAPANTEGGDDDEGEGDEIQGKGLSDDSSEEEDEDEEAERRVRDGFIVDEDDAEEDEDQEEERRKRKKRRKHKHRRRERDEEEDLDEEDLELLEENTGGRIGRSRLTRLRRGRSSESGDEGESSKRKAVVESSDDDLDENNIIGSRQIQDIQNIWEDEKAGDEDEDMDMDDFIDDEEEEEEGAGAMAEEEREERRRERKRLEKERRKKALRSNPALTGIDQNTWDEIQDVFGDGHDYDWALDEEENELVEEVEKLEVKYRDIFEPEEIRHKLLTEDDDLIRSYDIPERMQLAVSTLSGYTQLAIPEPLTQAECVDAAAWVAPRLASKERDFFMPDGRFHHLLRDLVEAVTRTLEYLLVQHLEVPYIYAHRRDYISYFNPKDPRNRVELLNQEDLWRIYGLGQKYRSLIERQKSLQSTYERLGIKDAYYEETLKMKLDSIETVADVGQWLAMRYKSNKRDNIELRFHDDEEQVEAKKHKQPVRMTAYEQARKSLAGSLADKFGIKSHQVVLNYIHMQESHNQHNVHFVEDAELPPSTYAEQFVNPDPTKAQPAEEVLRQARMILSTELSSDPILRQEIRRLFKASGQMSCSPTERGKVKIDEFHPYNNFKYLLNKPIATMLRSIQYMNICAAEAEHLVTVSVTLPADVKHDFAQKLHKAFASDSYSDAAKAWNDERELVVQDAIERLLPIGAKWARDYLREEVEEYLAKACGEAFYERINVAPFSPPNLQEDEPPSVLAVSWGKGDQRTDSINAVFLDELGRIRDHITIDNLTDDANKDEFTELVKRRKPDVIVVGGMSITTTKLMQTLKELVAKMFGDDQAETSWGEDSRSEPSQAPPVVYIQDEVARIYQHSQRAEDDFPQLSLVGRYCAGLARYAQSPLNEYAALGSDLTAITFDEEAQPLISREKLLSALERVLVDVVNKVGVDINRAANEPYYSHLLPYVAGLGPRKAQAVIKKIYSLGGTLVNREQFIKSQILTTKIFLNAAGFLRIAQDPDYKEPKGRGSDYSLSPDPLDDTRIHPEDYELARKMATDALELDEEDVHDEHPSHVVSVLMKDDEAGKKLDELNLDEFAVNMYETNRDLKRHTLNVIRAELIKPFGELRPKFNLPSAWEVVTMLTSETQRTLRVGFVVSVQIVVIKQNYVVVKLDSGIEGIINANYLCDTPAKPETVVFKGQTIPGVIIDVKLDLEQSHFAVELSSRSSDVQQGDSQFRRVQPDDCSNRAQAERDNDIIQRKKRAEVNRARRVVKHPNFHNFNSSQAEAFLEKQQIGEVVIRPSSKGTDHLAVTWKVADKLYQHIDVIERNAVIGGQSMGTTLVVDGKHEYADLDEVIVSHIHAMARRVEDLMNHEKFKKDDDELQKFLVNFVSANPSKSIYGFTLNRKRPGHFNLSFLARKGSSIQTWPVRVAPDAYYLFDTAAVGIPELCDAFKVRHLHESQKGPGVAAGGKTPYGAGRMTPAHTPGYATPGRMSVRHPASRTPNPYSGPTPSHQPAQGTPMGMPPPTTPYAFGATPNPAAFGYQTPNVPPPGYGQPPPPPGMNPARAAMIQNSGSAGWPQGGGGRW